MPTNNMNKRVYRKINEKEAEHHATTHCRNLGLKPTSPKYENAFQEAFIEYIKGINEATTVASNPTQMNPSTPKIPEYVYEQFGLWLDGEKSFFYRLGKDRRIGKEKLKQLKNQFKSAVGNLAQIYLQLSEGMTTKTTVDKDTGAKDPLSDFEYREFPENYPPDSSNLSDMIQVEKNRYIRMFVASKIIFHLEKEVFNLQRYFNKHTFTEVLANQKFSYMDKDRDTGDITFSSISKKPARINFVRRVIAMLELNEKIEKEGTQAAQDSGLMTEDGQIKVKEYKEKKKKD